MGDRAAKDALNGGFAEPAGAGLATRRGIQRVGRDVLAERLAAGYPEWQIAGPLTSAEAAS